MTLLEILGLVFIAVLVLNFVVWFLAVKYSAFFNSNYLKLKVSEPEKVE